MDHAGLIDYRHRINEGELQVVRVIRAETGRPRRPKKFKERTGELKPYAHRQRGC